MNLNKIKEALNSGMPNELIRMTILEIISNDESAIPQLLEILNHERSRKKQLIADMNLELSRSYLALEEPIFRKDGFVVKKIKEFYETNKDQVSNLFEKQDNK